MKSPRRALTLVIALLVLLLGAEAFARWGLGLGTPPLHEVVP